MSLLFVCDGCDVRAVGGKYGLPPIAWACRWLPDDDQRAVHHCGKPECRDKINALTKAPELVLPY